MSGSTLLEADIPLKMDSSASLAVIKEGCEPGALVRFLLRDGPPVAGRYLFQAGMHFLHVSDQSSLFGKVVGPFPLDGIDTIIVLQTVEDIRCERRKRSRGDIVPGRQPVTADDFEYRLGLLARLAAQEDHLPRRQQILHQFHDLAEQIDLSKAKCQWVLLSARWTMVSNSPPTLKDLWGEDVASPSLLRRPAKTDFEPNKALRRRREIPSFVRNDPRSIRNMLSTLIAHGFKARVTRLGDPEWDLGTIQIDIQEPKPARFDAIAERAPTGVMVWRLRWGGNCSTAGIRRYNAACRSDKYHLLEGLVLSSNHSQSGGTVPATVAA